MNTRCEH